jgi:hypothetical protein
MKMSLLIPREKEIGVIVKGNESSRMRGMINMIGTGIRMIQDITVKGKVMITTGGNIQQQREQDKELATIKTLPEMGTRKWKIMILYKIITNTKHDSQEDTVTNNSSTQQNRTVDLLTSRTGAYIPPAKLRMMQARITEKSGAVYQRIALEALKKSIHEHIVFQFLVWGSFRSPLFCLGQVYTPLR